MKPPKSGGEFWGFNEETDEDSYSFDEDEENTAGFKPILKVIILLKYTSNKYNLKLMFELYDLFIFCAQ